MLAMAWGVKSGNVCAARDAATYTAPACITQPAYVQPVNQECMVESLSCALCEFVHWQTIMLMQSQEEAYTRSKDQQYVHHLGSVRLGHLKKASLRHEAKSGECPEGVRQILAVAGVERRHS